MKKKFFVIAILLFSVAVIVIGLSTYIKKAYDVRVIAPTCTETGYSIYINKKDNTTQIKDIVPAKGHSYDDWVVKNTATEMSAGERIHRCRVCGYEETEQYYAEASLPRLMFWGDLTGIGKKDEVSVSVALDTDEISFDGFARLKYQGHSSLKYDKKNFTVKFFENESCTVKKKLKFSHWNEENKYILKSNYIDVSRVRNLACADIWSRMVSTRNNLHNRLTGLSNYGSVDGFPIEVYVNDEFLGLYNLTLHKDDDLFGMKEGVKDGIVIINEGNTQSALFKDKINWDNSEDWEVEFCGTDDDRWICNKTNEFIDFVINSNNAEFKKNLSEYADVDSLIDYMIAMYSLGLNTSYTKDLMFVTYNNGPWIASLFDMENAFGLSPDGEYFYSVSDVLPSVGSGNWSSNTDSLLWDRLLENFYKEICDRYKTLRKDILSKDNIISLVEEKFKIIPKAVNESDFKLYPNQPQKDMDHIIQIKEYVEKRLGLLDEKFVH